MSNPTYHEEKTVLRRGYSLVAGLDEVGRGPLAGPVVAGLAILPSCPKGPWVKHVRDSKQLSAHQRKRVLNLLKEASVTLQVGISSHNEIDEYGIVSATHLAMERALNAVPLMPQFLLLDGYPLPTVSVPQKHIIRGDSKCLSIAAASIVAKVTRDHIMEQQDDLYPCYGFAKHKGYATKEHLLNLRNFGPSPIHRYSFAPVRDWKLLT